MEVERLVGGENWEEVRRQKNLGVRRLLAEEATHLQFQLFVCFLRKGAPGKGGLQEKEVG